MDAAGAPEAPPSGSGGDGELEGAKAFCMNSPKLGLEMLVPWIRDGMSGLMPISSSSSSGRFSISRTLMFGKPSDPDMTGLTALTAVIFPGSDPRLGVVPSIRSSRSPSSLSRPLNDGGMSSELLRLPRLERGSVPDCISCVQKSIMSTDLPNGDALMKFGDMAISMLPDPKDPVGGHSGKAGKLPNPDEGPGSSPRFRMLVLPRDLTVAATVGGGSKPT